MTDSNELKELENVIESGFELFKEYKEISKEYKEQRQLETNYIFDNILKSELELIRNKRKGLNARTNLPTEIKVKKILQLANEEKRVKSKQYRESYEKMTELSLVNSNKKFLKEKEKIRKIKKKILTSIKTILSQLKKKIDDKDFRQLVKDIYKTTYPLSNGKKITFKTLMHHLESGEISEEVAKAKNTKQIDQLESIKNIANRKKQMEIGITKKEIEKLLKEYDKTLESLKKIAAIKFPNKEITNNDISSLLEKKYNKENSEEYKKIINKLGSQFKKLNFEVQIKIKKLEKLQESS